MSNTRWPLVPGDPNHGGRVARAREMFFAQGLDANSLVAPHIWQSWQRCRQKNDGPIDDAPLPGAQLRDRRERSMRLLECAQPELDFLAGHALDAGCVVVLSDADGLILDEIGSADFLPKAQRVTLTSGALWSESSRGTNAIGTALTERKPLMVLGGEHYLSQHGALGCAAAPIFTGRGSIAGLLDMSGDSAAVTPHALGLVRMAAAQVEHRMMLAEASGHLLRFHARPSLLGTAREGLLVIDDGRLVAANRVALDLLGSAWEDLLDTPVERLLGLRWTRLQPGARLLTLPGGQQIAAAVEPSLQGPGTHRFMKRAPAAPDTPAPPREDDIEPLLAKAVKVLGQGLPVLVTGETGSGKDVFARRLHAAGSRRQGPFVAVNCAALPETLIEAELFGYEAGAFTGARRHGAAGKIREAQGGILFLDEIGDMPLALQTRLLRVLEDKVVTPLGSNAGIKVDFDLVCATHRDLDDMVARGLFRDDLRYRVRGYEVKIPALRERGDRLQLIDRLFASLVGTRPVHLSAAARAELAGRPWPGNVRELHSLLRAAVALADDGALIDVGDLSYSPPAPTHPKLARGLTTSHSPAPAAIDTASLADLERDAIERALAECEGNMSLAAKRLGIHRSTLYRRLGQRH